MSIKRRGYWSRLILSLLVAAAILYPLAKLAQPYLVRWQAMRNLNSDVLTERERALNYVLRSASDDPTVLTDAVQQMDHLDDETRFAQLMLIFDQLGQWRRPLVPDRHWFRWLGMLATDKDPKARILASQELADMTDAADAAPLITMLNKFITDPKDDVRYNAMVAAAELWSVNRGSMAMQTIVARASGDANAEISRQAWIFLGLMGVPDDLKPEWRTISPRAALPMFWAMTRAQPGAITPAIDAARETAAPTSTRAAAIFSLVYSTHPDAPSTLHNLLTQPLTEQTSPEQLAILWRAILAAPPMKTSSAATPFNDNIQHILDFITTRAHNNDEALAPLAFAAAYRLGSIPAFQPSDAFPEDQDLRPALGAIAAAESRDASTPPPSFDDAPALYRFALVERTHNAEVLLVEGDFTAAESALRDQACLLAARYLDKTKQTELARQLLLNFNDQARRSGAILAGLTNIQPEGRFETTTGPSEPFDLLKKRTEIESDWLVAQVLRLGLWMQDREPGVTAITVQSLLTRTDLPTTTVLLAMLHKGDNTALEYLLNPRGEPRADLLTLFVHKRWWRVLSQHLPADAPLQLDLWADEEVQRFQIDVLRNWFLLERHKKSPPPEITPPRS